VYTLKGHENSVWAVLALPNDEYLTASADKTIRYWRGDKQISVITKHTEVVRGLCEIPNLGFASCGNDSYVFLAPLKTVLMAV
jgi:phospholipase A-2-activating protein